VALAKHKQHSLWNVYHYSVRERCRRHVAATIVIVSPGFGSFPSGNSVSGAHRSATQSNHRCRAHSPDK
jgi:hypothetical protein